MGNTQGHMETLADGTHWPRQHAPLAISGPPAAVPTDTSLVASSNKSGEWKTKYEEAVEQIKKLEEKTKELERKTKEDDKRMGILNQSVASLKKKLSVERGQRRQEQRAKMSLSQSSLSSLSSGPPKKRSRPLEATAAHFTSTESTGSTSSERTLTVPMAQFTEVFEQREKLRAILARFGVEDESDFEDVKAAERSIISYEERAEAAEKQLETKGAEIAERDREINHLNEEITDLKRKAEELENEVAKIPILSSMGAELHDKVIGLEDELNKKTDEVDGLTRALEVKTQQQLLELERLNGEVNETRKEFSQLSELKTKAEVGKAFAAREHDKVLVEKETEMVELKKKHETQQKELREKLQAEVNKLQGELDNWHKWNIFKLQKPGLSAAHLHMPPPNMNTPRTPMPRGQMTPAHGATSSYPLPPAVQLNEKNWQTGNADYRPVLFPPGPPPVFPPTPSPFFSNQLPERAGFQTPVRPTQGFQRMQIHQSMPPPHLQNGRTNGGY